MRFAKTLFQGPSIACLAAVIAMGFAASPALAQSKGKPGGGTSYLYSLTDLRGLPGYALQSDGRFITNRDGGGGRLIYGQSHQYIQGSPAQPYPVLWRIAADGSFPVTDPLNLELPTWAAEVEPQGMNSLGFGVGVTRRSLEQDEMGNWVNPSYVDVPDIGYREVPGGVSRNTFVNAINDSGLIVGTFAIANPDAPDGEWYVGGLWQVDLAGNISAPISLGDFYPVDINNHGVMAGRALGWPAIAWFDAGALQVRLLDTSLRYWGADAAALNDWPADDERLTVVGVSYADQTGDFNAPNRGFAWRPFNSASPTTVLGTLGGLESSALDVNRAGQIVGWSDTKRAGQQAFVYANGVMTNLNSVVNVGDKTLQWARGINDDGDITGFMRIPRPVSEQHGFLLRPNVSN
jgi:probable HAF family extracellular repeat protein